MKTPNTLACIAAVTTLSGCAQMAQMLIEANEFQSTQPPTRNYVTNPIMAPAPVQYNQPTFGNTGSEGYQTIMVNTPQGIVYKQCKVFNGKVAYCL